MAWQREHRGGANVRSAHDAPSMQEIFCRSLATHWQGRFSAKTRLLVICSNRDATVDISFLRPFENVANTSMLVLDEQALTALYAKQGMDEETPGLDLILEGFNPTHVIGCRYWGNRTSEIMATLRKRDVPVITFLDDDLLNVPLEAGQNVAAYFENPERRSALTTWIEDADLLLVSTPILATSLKTRRKRRPLETCNIYRSVTEDELALIPMIENDQDCIGYMGSQSHADDLETWVPALVTLMHDRPGLRFETFGTIPMPTALKAFGNRVFARGKAQTYSEFIHTLRMTGWSLGLAPLTQSTFNANKADTKWVEYTLAGIPTIASPGPVYDGAISQNACVPANPADAAQVIAEVLDDPKARNKLLSKSETALRNNYTVAQKRAFLLKVLKNVKRKSSK